MEIINDYYSDEWKGQGGIGGEANPPESDMSWWYREPAKKFWEGLPIGTGRFFGMVYGGVPEETIVFNDETLWTGKPNNPVNPKGLASLPEVRNLVLQGQYQEAFNHSYNLFSVPRHVQFYQPMGMLKLQLDGHHRVYDYRRELDMDRAVAEVNYKLGNALIKREVFASYPDQVIVVRLTSNKKNQFSLKIEFDSIQPSAVVKAAGNNELVMTGRSTEVDMESAMTWEARARIINEGGTVHFSETTDESGKNNPVIRVQRADAVTIILAGATNHVNWKDISADPAKRCAEYLKASEKSYDELLRRHLEDYQPLFRACELYLGKTKAASDDTTTRLINLRSRKRTYHERLDIIQECPDPHFITQYFQYGRYLLLAGSRRGTLAFNNHNPWLDNMLGRWRGRWTLNINIQECYWCTENCNLPETNDALLLFVKQLAESGERTARELYGCSGWVAHHGADIWMNTAPTDRPRHGIFPTAGAWLCQQLWEHFIFNPDKEYLKEIYPILRGSALFFQDFLVEDPETGWLVTALSASPENEFRTPDGQTSTIDKCTAMDSQIIRDLFNFCITAAKILNEDEKMKDTLEEILEKLPPHQIGRWGKLQEWLHDWEEPVEKHRHISHLYAMYPSNQITLRGTPELALAVHKALEHRGDKLLGWTGAWKINLYARFEDGERAYDILDRMITSTSLHPQPDDSDRVPSMEGNQAIQGITAGIAEMLLQSHAGEISLLPALPRVWYTGYVKGLRARGGYEVDIAWEDGYLKESFIKAKHSGNCKLRTYTPVKISLNGKEVAATQPGAMVTEFEVKAGERYLVSPMPKR